MSKITVGLVLFTVFVVLNAEISNEKSFTELNIQELNLDNFYKVVNQIDKHVVVMLYSSESWCMHCRRLDPKYKEIAETYQKNDKDGSFVFARMDLHTHKPPDLKIIGYPSIKLFKKGNKEFDYRGKNEIDPITKFIDEHTKGRSDL